MAKPVTNRRNWWGGGDEELEAEVMGMLVDLARYVLRQVDPRHSNYVDVDELVAEAWLHSVRYLDGFDRGDLLNCIGPMKQEYCRLRYRFFSRSRSRKHPVAQISDDYPLVCHRGQWGVRCLDIWDSIRSRCTPRQREIVLSRWEGRERAESGRRVGVSSPETVRQECLAVRRLVEGDGIILEWR
jgi:hypothetical protein